MRSATVFRVRPPATDIESVPPEEWLAKKERYAAFLSPRRPSIPNDLWRFFRDDFFHDGSFEAFGWEKLPRDLWVPLNCPNIKRLYPGDRYSYLNASFRCAFSGVYRLTIQTYECDSSPPELGTLDFMGAEIEAEQELIAAATAETGDEHHSLLMDAGECSIAIVFQSIGVYPLEPLAFAALLDDERFVIPLAD